MPEIVDTLRELDRWYNEIPGGTERPVLLSKLATLELCGWLEYRFDALIHAAGAKAGLEKAWIDDEVVKLTYGFAYPEHFRRMLCRLVGEAAVLHVEEVFEADNPGKLEILKSSLGTLWKSRGFLAHTHMAAPPLAQQQTLNAPSWSLNQQRVIGKMIDLYEASLLKAFARTIAKP